MEITTQVYKPISPLIIYFKMKIKIIAILLFGIFIHSCDKDDEAKIDSEGPEMNLIKPSSDSTYFSLTNLPVVVNITENDQLHSMAVKISRDKDSSIVFSKHTHLHYQSYLYETSMLLPVVEDSLELFTIELLATDHAGNSNSKTINVRVKNN